MERDSPDVNRSIASKWVNVGEKIGQDKFYCLPITSSTLPPKKIKEMKRKKLFKSHLKTKYDLMIVRKREKSVRVSFTRSDAQM